MTKHQDDDILYPSSKGYSKLIRKLNPELEKHYNTLRGDFLNDRI